MQDIILLHGAIGAKDQMQPLADALRDNYTVHTIDFSGHGGKMFPLEDFSIPFFADEVLGYLRQEEITRSHIFGYSMGGYVAMYLAKQHPELTGKIITLATKFHWDEAVAVKEIQKLDPETIIQKVPAFAAELLERHLPNDWKTVLTRTKEMLIQLGRHNSLTPADYRNIAAPCLLLLGDNDKMVTQEETIAVQMALPDGEFKLLPDTPHPIEGVNSELLAAMIKDFLEK